MRESAFWKTFSKHIPPRAMAVRIENSTSPDMPDVLITCDGNTFLVELKAGLRTKATSGQISWARRWMAAGGTSWFLINHAGDLYLIPGYADPNELIPQWRIEDCHEAVEMMLK